VRTGEGEPDLSLPRIPFADLHGADFDEFVRAFAYDSKLEPLTLSARLLVF
jgi:hypothetical protein